jgi:hypothetical protein
LDFYRRLIKCGVVGVAAADRGFITPFFVERKKKRQRLVLDCCRPNCYSKGLPCPDVATAENLQRVEIGSGCLHEAEAGIETCSYQCGVEVWMCDCFRPHDELNGDEQRELSLDADIRGDCVASDFVGHLCLATLPTGFSRAFDLAQVLHEEVIAKGRCVAGSWPIPSLSKRFVALPYCCNFAVLGLKPAAVDHRLDVVVRAFRNIGLEQRDVQRASPTAQSLGSRVDRASGHVGPGAPGRGVRKPC